MNRIGKAILIVPTLAVLLSVAVSHTQNAYSDCFPNLEPNCPTPVDIGGSNRSMIETTPAPSLIGSTPMQEFGVFIGPIQKHTGIYHNENGIFIPWKVACKTAQQYLLAPCDSLVNPGGSLTSDGDHVVSCTWTGTWLSVAGASYLHLDISTIKAVLGPLAGLTGCGGIVDKNKITNSPIIQSFLQSAGSFSP